MEERYEMFTVLMNRIRRSIQRIKTEEMARYNLKSPHVTCLYYLYKYGSLTATQLCEICFEDKASVSRSVILLEKMGYTKYVNSSKKHYRSDITLTERGREISETIVRKVNDYIDEIGKDLTEKEKLILYKSLSTISNNLESVCGGFDNSSDFNE